MPLQDHFHPPVFPLHPWESFHAVWAGTLLEWLNRLLPPRYFAAIHIQLGSRVEADVAEFDRPVVEETQGNRPTGRLALATWAPLDLEGTYTEARTRSRL